jgi:hypothetical protein
MLRIIGIHASPTIIQTFLDEDASAASTRA